jgi:hypothetical protein
MQGTPRPVGDADDRDYQRACVSLGVSGAAYQVDLRPMHVGRQRTQRGVGWPIRQSRRPQWWRGFDVRASRNFAATAEAIIGPCGALLQCKSPASSGWALLADRGRDCLSELAYNSLLHIWFYEGLPFYLRVANSRRNDARYWKLTTSEKLSDGFVVENIE